MSFPVPGTLMIEPTESEALTELDRFCDAMIAIREEIGRVEAGEWSHGDSPLAHAPHPAADVATDSWSRPYSRDVAVTTVSPSKYWPPVSRIDGAYGDRNVMCSCPPVEAYAEARAAN
jgi:glycine dehydrogenase